MLYLDANATTPLDPRVLEAMLPFLRGEFGNPASQHGPGERAAAAVAEARASVARMLGAKSAREIVFTSGGTEADNAGIHAALSRGRARGAMHVLTTSVEHPAVRVPLERAARTGWAVEIIGVDRDGRMDGSRMLERIAALEGRLALVTTMWANNETGVAIERAELRAIGNATRRAGGAFHVDAVQAAGKLPLQIESLPIDLAAISAHKLHGPKGVGALYVREEFEAGGFEPLLTGGSQEEDRRGGTTNVAGVVGFGRAADLAREFAASPSQLARLCGLRDRLEADLQSRIRGTSINASGSPRVSNTSSVRFDGVDSALLVPLLADRGLCVSSGAACHAGSHAPSAVLLAMGLTPEEAVATLRLSLTRDATGPELAEAVDIVVRSVGEVRELLSG